MPEKFEHPITVLSVRRRCTLYLRAAGWSYDQIAERLHVTPQMVKKDLAAINRLFMPGITDGDEPAKGYRVVYTLGLLDAGVAPEEVRYFLTALHDRVALVMARDARARAEYDDRKYVLPTEDV